MHIPFSFYTVFNPLLNGQDSNYKTQAHEFYYRLKEQLLSGDSERSHLYWGKLKVSNFDESLDFKKFQNAFLDNQSKGIHTHLFISDFHHFWVCKVESVHQEIMDKFNTLAFYDDKEVEVWFKISDIDLISSEYSETAYYLSNLSVDNKYENHKIDNINPYVSGIRYPLVVQNRLSEMFFLESNLQGKRRVLSYNPLIQNPQESDSLAQVVQSYVLPLGVYGKLSESNKKKLIKIEIDITKARNYSAQLNFRIVKEYLSILESLLNDTFISFLRDCVGEKIKILKDSSGNLNFFEGTAYSDLANCYEQFSIKEIFELLENPHKLGEVNIDFIMQAKEKFWKYCKTDLLYLTQEMNLLDITLEQEFTQKESLLLRNAILGVGCKGVINSMISLYYDDEFKDSYFKKAS